MTKKDDAAKDDTGQRRTDGGLNRRSFLGAATAGVGLSMVGLPETTDVASGRVISANSSRLSDAYDLREQAASDYLSGSSLPSHPDNGDADRYGDKRGSYIKGLKLRHGSPDLGLVHPDAWQSLINALRTGAPSDFDSIITGGDRELVSPQASHRFEMVGLDPHQVTMPEAPAFDSDRVGAEMAEVYWQSLVRDYAFQTYGKNFAPEEQPLPGDAAYDLTQNFSDYRGPTNNRGDVSSNELFRGTSPGCLIGPYVSQLLWQPIPQGAIEVPQLINEPASNDYNNNDYSRWLDVIEGTAERGMEYPPRSDSPTTGDQVYIRNGRDLGEYAHLNYSFEPYLNAALILYYSEEVPLDPETPFIDQGNQSPYITFGGVGIFDLVTSAATYAASAGWFQKWLVHLRARPETYAGRIHNVMEGNADYDISSELLDDSLILTRVYDYNADGQYGTYGDGTYLLPMAYKEGSPAHPAYPSGHAIIAGACTTVLKAVFDESHTFSDPVQATTDGTSLESIDASLTVGGELNKLAENVSIGRNFAGVHYRSDASEGLRAGEQVGVELLKYALRKTNEPAPSLTFEDFDGNTRTISP